MTPHESLNAFLKLGIEKLETAMDMDNGFKRAQRAYENMLPDEVKQWKCEDCKGTGIGKYHPECPSCDGEGFKVYTEKDIDEMRADAMEDRRNEIEDND